MAGAACMCRAAIFKIEIYHVKIHRPAIVLLSMLHISSLHWPSWITRGYFIRSRFAYCIRSNCQFHSLYWHVPKDGRYIAILSHCFRLWHHNACLAEISFDAACQSSMYGTLCSFMFHDAECFESVDSFKDAIIAAGFDLDERCGMRPEYIWWPHSTLFCSAAKIESGS